jgi:hypothetical protein
MSNDNDGSYVYRCTIAGERAEVTLYMSGQYAGDLDEARLIIENDEPLYRELYRSAFGAQVSDAAYDAEWQDESLTRAESDER